MELSKQSGQAKRLSRTTNKPQRQKVDLRPKLARLGLLSLMGTIILVAIIILVALISPSVTLANSVRAGSGSGDTSGSDGSDGSDAAGAATATVGADSFTSVDSQQANKSHHRPAAFGSGNGPSIRGRKRKALQLEESGQPLWVPPALHGSNDNQQQQQHQQRITKKFGPQDLAGPFDQVNSADLPAEFRDDPLETDQEAPREQSKLAKLCQQTSSVLASVLPAPFGGQKRSILCQFFGQIPMTSGGAQSNKRGSSKGVPLAKELDSLAIIHPLDQQRQQQRPIMLMRPMKHPIELLLEHQRQQIQLASRIQQQQQQQQQQQSQLQDLKSAASVLDYSYQQRLEAPQTMQRPDEAKQRSKSKGQAKSQEKFSQPIEVSASPTLSTSGWRIFENLPEQQQPNKSSPSSSSSTPSGLSRTSRTEAQTETRNQSSAPGEQASTAMASSTSSSAPPSPSTSPSPSPSPSPSQSSSQAAPATISIQKELNLTPEKLGAAQLLVLGRPPNYPTNNRQQQTTQSPSVAKLSESSKSTARPKQPEKQELRTIEVVAQSNNPTSSPQSQATADPTAEAARGTSSSTNQRAGASNHLAQNREDLVIASINNLTRIAFGNQLRDTFKVINRLIDEQAGLFASPQPPKSDHESLMMNESQKEAKKVTANSTSGPESSKKKTKPRERDVNSGPTTASPKVSAQSPKTNKRLNPTVPVKTSTGTESLQSHKRPQAGPTKIKTTKSAAKDKATHLDSKEATTKEHPRQAERKSTISSLESRRLSSHASVSRSLPLDSVRKTTPLRPLAPFESDWPTTVVVDEIRRDRNSRNKAATNRDTPIKGSTTGDQNRLVPPASQHNSWMIPDERSTDMFGLDWAAPTTRAATRGPPPSSATSRRWIPKVTTEGLSQAAKLTSKQALVLNRLESKAADRLAAKQDSLTTLKASLNSSQSPRYAPTTSSPATVTSAQSDSSTQGAVQSRWIPTVALSRPTSVEVRQSSTSTTTNSPPPTTTTTVGSSSPRSAPQTTGNQQSESKAAAPSSREPPTQSDLMEARASDSISKFTTTHWNEANEMLATTRRLFQQPQPQIAQTGEFFNAETISSWPERYQTMLEGSLRTTLAMETTRRNGETYSTSPQETPIQPTGDKLARHKYATSSLPATDQQQQQQADQTTTRRMDQFESTSITVLPANHKFSTTRDDYYSSPPANEMQLQQKATTTAQNLMELSTSSGNNKQTNQTGPLKPPYLELQQVGLAPEAPMLITSNSNSSAAPRRTIYELPAAVARSFVGPHHTSLAHQGLSLSALKMLSRGLLATLGNRSLISPPVEQSIGPNSQHHVADSEALNSSDRLLEMLGAQQNLSLPEMLPMSQYELLPNGTAGLVEGDPEEANDKANSSSKWLLSRASNLLNDLKQLEHRKAAALLAAIRYQVPGPLVRPWDLNSDLQQASDRFDGAESEAERDYLRANLWLSRASDAIRSAFAKQRVVPRNELEARLSGRTGLNSSSSGSDRRSDFSSDTTSEDMENTFFVMGGNTTRNKQDANYVFVADNSSSSDDHLAPQLKQRVHLAQKLPPNSRKHPQTGLDDGLESFELSSAQEGARNGKVGQQYPKYIHSSGYKTSWSPKPIDLQPGYSGQLSSSAAIEARLRNHSSNPRKVPSQSTIDIAGAKQLDHGHSSPGFDCSDRAAGFHPDASTNCQHRPPVDIQLPPTDEI